MNEIFLITRPDHEEVVSYLFHWSQEIIEFAKNEGVRFHELPREKATNAQVASFINSANPKLIIFHGHGDQDMICGHKDEPLVVSDKNESILRNTITYAVACDAAASLGKRAVAKGCNVFIGYEGPFAFVRDASRVCNPPKDKHAAPFKDVSNTISIELLRGKTAQEAFKKSQQKIEKLIKEYGTSDADPVNKEIRFWLFWNMQFQKVIGDSNARFIK